MYVHSFVTGAIRIATPCRPESLQRLASVMATNPSVSVAPRIATKLVVATTLVVTVLAITMMFLEPQGMLRWLLALAFLPAAVGSLMATARRRKSGTESRRVFGRIRAALVGAGVLLATALLFSVTDSLGWTGTDGEPQGRGLLMFLPAIIAVLAELAGMALENVAAREPKKHDDADRRD